MNAVNWILLVILFFLVVGLSVLFNIIQTKSNKTKEHSSQKLENSEAISAELTQDKKFSQKKTWRTNPSRRRPRRIIKVYPPPKPQTLLAHPPQPALAHPPEPEILESSPKIERHSSYGYEMIQHSQEHNPWARETIEI